MLVIYLTNRPPTDHFLNHYTKQSPLSWEDGGGTGTGTGTGAGIGTGTGTGTGGYLCPLDKLQSSVRARVEELLTGNDKALQQDDLLISFLSELPTAQALKVGGEGALS